MGKEGGVGGSEGRGVACEVGLGSTGDGDRERADDATCAEERTLPSSVRSWCSRHDRSGNTLTGSSVDDGIVGERAAREDDCTLGDDDDALDVPVSKRDCAKDESADPKPV